jgi:hypothetical protein
MAWTFEAFRSSWGQASLETTMIYTHVAKLRGVVGVKSPLDQ